MRKFNVRWWKVGWDWGASVDIILAIEDAINLCLFREAASQEAIELFLSLDPEKSQIQ